jgi:transposase
VDFSLLYAADGKPALSPNLLALVSVFQFMENLPDREAADAVRARLDWKYALHLPLADTGFDASVLSEFRGRLAAHGTAQAMFEELLGRLRALGLLDKGGKQRTDATAVLAATQTLNRVQLVAETMRLALEALAAYRPDWLQTVAWPHWYERYSLVLTGFRLPRSPDKQAALALDIARDGFHLLSALSQPQAPSQAGHLPEVAVLAQVWQQHFAQGEDGPTWRPKAEKPPSSQIIDTPHDPEVRFASHGQQHWRGYQVHWTESCDAELPHLITHVATTPSHVTHDQVLGRIHADLQRLDLLPDEHLVDGGYTSAGNVLASQAYDVHLIGPLAQDASWQAHTPGGITLDQFQIDRAQQQATCPQGQTSAHWRERCNRQGVLEVQIGFPSAACQACELRQRCTRAADGGRRLKITQYHELTQAGRQRQQTAAFRAEYALRAGVEGTVSATVRQHGARRTRYIGEAKTEVQNLLIAMAANVRRAALWLMGDRPGTTRPPGLSCLAPAQLAA